VQAVQFGYAGWRASSLRHGIPLPEDVSRPGRCGSRQCSHGFPANPISGV